MELLDFKCTFVNTEKVKQSHVGTHLKPIDFFKSYVLLNIFKNTLSKTKFFATIVVNYFAMSNFMAQQAKTPYPGGVRMSRNLLVLMCLSLQHSSHSESASFLGREECQHQRYYDASRLV